MMHQKTIVQLTLLVLFSCIFFIAFYAWTRGSSVLAIGLDTSLTNGLIMVLSFVGITQSTLHLVRHH